MDAQQLEQELQLYPDQMTHQERSAAYAAGLEVDRLPVSISVREHLAPLYGYTAGQYRRDFAVKALVYHQACTDFDCLGISIGPNLKKIGEALGAKAVYPEEDIDYLTDQPLKNYADLPAYQPPAPQKSAVLSALLTEIEQYLEHFGADFPISTEIGGPMSTAISIRPVDKVMRDCITQPDQLRLLLDFAVECQLEWVRTVHRLYGIRNVNIADPAASLNLISPAMFRRLVMPPLQRMVQEVIAITGRKPGFHICGKTKAIWPDIAALGVANFRVDNCESLLELKDSIGDKLVIAGNIPPVEIMLHGDIDAVLDAGRQCIAQAADSPLGFTLAAGCQLPPGVSSANLKAMLLAARKYGRHAKKGRPCPAAAAN